jgi:hypothetical protein
MERWRKSSRSGSESNCVEVEHTFKAVRDSKNPNAVLAVDVHALVNALKGERFDS